MPSISVIQVDSILNWQKQIYGNFCKKVHVFFFFQTHCNVYLGFCKYKNSNGLVAILKISNFAGDHHQPQQYKNWHTWHWILSNSSLNYCCTKCHIYPLKNYLLATNHNISMKIFHMPLLLCCFSFDFFTRCLSANESSDTLSFCISTSLLFLVLLEPSN